MHSQQIGLLVLMAVLGAGVIGSYLQGFSAHPGSADKLWGGVTGGLRYMNYVLMTGAAVGFFLFSYWLLFRADPDTVTVFGGPGYWMFFIIFIVILVPSILWMPFLFAHLGSGGNGWWLAVRVVLAFVGLGSLALLAAIITASPGDSGVAYWLAVVGAGLFALQTAVNDMFIWPALFEA